MIIDFFLDLLSMISERTNVDYRSVRRFNADHSAKNLIDMLNSQVLAVAKAESVLPTPFPLLE